RAVDGSATIIQPVIAPLYASRSVHQLLDFLLGGDDPAPDAAVKTTWRSTFGTDFDDRWTRALHDGFVTGSGAQPVTISAKPPAPPQLKDNADDQVEIVFNPDPCVWDGRFANIAWLQELPKPLTKITWDNVIAISPAIAAQYALANGDVT